MSPETRHIVVPRTARYQTAGDLEGELDEVVLLCHGYGQLASEILFAARALESPRRLLVAPEALSRFYLGHPSRVGGSWMTREDRLSEIEDYVRYLTLLYAQIFAVVDRARVELRVLGFSQGGATAARWAVRAEAPVDHLILWGSTVPPELADEDALSPFKAMRLTLAGGHRDEFLSDAVWEEQRSRLSAHGVRFDEYRFDGGHRLDDDTLRRIVEK